MFRTRFVSIGIAAALLVTAFSLASAAHPRRPMKPKTDVSLEIAKIHWEYNSSANDLGVQVSIDGEDWRRLRIRNPGGKTIFDVEGKGPYAELGLTELFFEGAEPSLDEFPLQDLLDRFPEGVYEFEGKTVDGEEVDGESLFTHAIPAGPVVTLTTGANDLMRVSWTAVTTTPPGFPIHPIEIVRYEVLVDDSFDIFVPGSTLGVTIPPEFVASLTAGDHQVEVLAIERSANQTITEAPFTK